MTRGSLTRIVRTLIRALLLMTTAAAGAVEVAGARLDDAIVLAGRELQLNGAGLRTIFIVKSYVAGLYVARKSRDAAELISQSGPRRLAMRMLTDKSATRLGKVLNEGLRNNHSDAELTAMQERIAALNAALDEIGNARKGDLLTFDVADGRIRIEVNGVPKGQPIDGEDFYSALLRVFLGENPADPDLKKSLLGG